MNTIKAWHLLLVFILILLGDYAAAITIDITQRGQLLFSLLLLIISLAIWKTPYNELARRSLMILSTYVGFRFLLWRIWHTLHVSTPLNSLFCAILLISECYTLMMLTLFFLRTVVLDRNVVSQPPGADFYPTVDIFIVTYNESLPILRRTIVGALNINYENKNVYVCDDGRRLDVLALVESLGCNYLTRPDNKHAKAGNFNHAMQNTDSEFILLLDADHVPFASILNKAIGFFRDPKVAVVQAAHQFMNPGPSERNLHVEGQVPVEQDLFFQIVQVGANYWKAAFCAGSAAVFRRSALDKIGGMATQTVTEDLETSLKMQRLGYEIVYCPQSQIIGLNPESLGGYLTQQCRWARGGIQMMILQNPFLGPGLTFVQRLCYFAAMAHYLFPFSRLTFYAIPVAYLCFNVWSISVSFSQYALMALPYLTLYWLANNYTFRNYRHSFWSDIYAAIVAPVLAYYCIRTFINPFGARFEVTPKGDMRGHLSFDIRLLWPNLVILSIFLLAVVCGLIKAWLAPGQLVAVLINLFWNLYNSVVVLSAILVGMERPEQRTGYRVLRAMPITISRGGDTSLRIGGLTLDLNEYGTQVRLASDCSENFERGDRLIFSLDDLTGELIEVEAVIRRKRIENTQQVLGLQFYENNLATKRRLIEIAYCSADNWSKRTEPNDSLWLSFKMVITSPLRVLANTSRREWSSAYDSSEIPVFLDRLRCAVGRSIKSDLSQRQKSLTESAKSLAPDRELKH